ncbi:polysaccharide deacetylase family protein [Ruminococcus flavefaciens]|uniref:Polysaccharide deacetylase n=1 Tax=Ruminococcus flavefaciens TaxID=1265 RepID=A0A1M7I1P4_RUMFL|nr:polysaccharide deacetylase family protein [Ruminococcus flavefaciens]SHM34692.1 Polysaccharide deacetylase [Ruminococcus flavefaciens]
MYKCFGLKRIFSRAAVLILLAAICCGALFPLRYGISSAAEASAERPVPLPVIMYHSVCEKAPADYIVSPLQLENDLIWLKDHGYTSVSAQQLIDYTNKNGELPQKPVLITFDDGFYNNLSIALPLLEKYDMCAIVSIVGRYTDDYAPADPHADAYSYLTWEDISQLIASNRIEIGSHTYDMHSRDSRRQGCAINPDETPEQYSYTLNMDIGLLNTELHDSCGISPVVFAYPFGALCRESLPVLRDNGIKISLTCREGMNYITRSPDCLYGIFRNNRSGLVSTEEYMSELTKELPESQ